MTGADSDSEKQTQKEPAEASLASQTNDGSSAQLHATGEQTATAVSARSIAPSSQPIQPESQLPVSTSTEEALRPSIASLPEQVFVTQASPPPPNLGPVLFPPHPAVLQNTIQQPVAQAAGTQRFQLKQPNDFSTVQHINNNQQTKEPTKEAGAIAAPKKTADTASGAGSEHTNKDSDVSNALNPSKQAFKPGSMVVDSRNNVKNFAASSKTLHSKQSAANQNALPPGSQMSVVEEDPLPPVEHGIYRPAMMRKRKWLQDSSILIPLTPHTTGSANDKLLRNNATNSTSTSISCSCKSTRCLQLLCECFAAVKFCGPRCSCRTQSCSNGNDMNDAHLLERRRKAVWDAVAVDSVNAFRSAEPEAKCGNPACDCFQTGVYCNPRHCECPEACHLIPITLKRYYIDPSVDVDQPGALNVTNHSPLAYSIPLKVNNVMAPGVSFVRADPRYDSNPSATPKNPKSAHQKLFHNLMLTPSKTIRTPLPEQNASTEGTETERLWSEENSKLMSYFANLRNIAETQLKTGDPTVYPEASNDAAAIYKTVLEDMEAVKNVVDAAKLNIMTVLYEQKKTGKYYCRAGKKRVEDEEFDSERPDDEAAAPEEMELRCDEPMPQFEDLADQLPVGSDESRHLLIRAVQDTAMMRELARIIRRKARELAMMRARKASP